MNVRPVSCSGCAGAVKVTVPELRLDRLKAIVASLMEPPGDPARFSGETGLRDDLGFDSVGVVDLMIEVERRFGVYFDPLEHDLLKVFETIGSLALFIEEMTGSVEPACEE